MPQTTLLSFFTQPVPTNTSLLTACNDDLIPNGSENGDRNGIAESRPVQDLLGGDNEGISVNSIFAVPSYSKAMIVDVQKCHLPQLKNITSTLFPVRYSDKFFSECITDSTVAALSKVMIHDSKPIGWIRCRLEQKPGFNDINQIYIQTIGLLAPFRGQGLATALLDQILQDSVCSKFNADCIYAHVWEANSDALGWYHRKGFKMVMLVDQYYRRLKPASAWIVRKEIKKTQT